MSSSQLASNAPRQARARVAARARREPGDQGKRGAELRESKPEIPFQGRGGASILLQILVGRLLEEAFPFLQLAARQALRFVVRRSRALRWPAGLAPRGELEEVAHPEQM